MAKKVPVTSVTPASKVKATSKAEQARTRNLVIGIASMTPAGRAAKTAATAAKAVSNARKVTTVAKAEAKANARGLKAAQKPTNKVGTKADRADRARLQGNANLIKNADPARANRTRGGSLAAMKAYGGQGVATAKLTPKQAALRAEINKELNPAQRAAKNKALANSAKGKIQTPTAEAARRRNLNK